MQPACIPVRMGICLAICGQLLSSLLGAALAARTCSRARDTSMHASTQMSARMSAAPATCAAHVRQGRMVQSMPRASYVGWRALHGLYSFGRNSRQTVVALLRGACGITSCICTFLCSCLCMCRCSCLCTVVHASMHIPHANACTSTHARTFARAHAHTAG